jgi:hypothetical protein
MEPLDRTIRVLVEHAWDREITWPEIDSWARNFNGQVAASERERFHALAALSRFIYFGKRLVREMLRSLYRDHFEAPLIHRIRRNLRGSRDETLIRTMYDRELRATRFIGVGNPSESGAHLLYYFRQINHLQKDLFIELGQATSLRPHQTAVRRIVFFDDLVGSAQQSSSYLSRSLKQLRKSNPQLDLRFMSLFATTTGLSKLNEDVLFAGGAASLFELDSTYKAFDVEQRYFSHALGPDFDLNLLEQLAKQYGGVLFPGHALGYRDGQLLIGFTHNTPDNTLPIFWNEGRTASWRPIFVRYDKVY